MPSHSKKQHDFMEAIAHNKAFAKKVHVSQSVGRDFAEADKGKHFKRGGDMAMNPKAAMAMAKIMGAAKRPRPMAAPAPMATPAPMAAPGGAPMMAHGGLTKAHHKHLAHHHLSMAEHHMSMHKGEEPHSKEMGEKALKHGGKAMKEHKYAKGGHVPGQYPLGQKMEKVKAGGNKGHGEHSIQERGHTRALHETMKGNTVGNGPLVNTKKHGGKIHKKM